MFCLCCIVLFFDWCCYILNVMYISGNRTFWCQFIGLCCIGVFLEWNYFHFDLPYSCLQACCFSSWTWFPLVLLQRNTTRKASAWDLSSGPAAEVRAGAKTHGEMVGEREKKQFRSISSERLQMELSHVMCFWLLQMDLLQALNIFH